MSAFALLKKGLVIILAFAVGWIVYIVALFVDPYGYDFSGFDGMIGLLIYFLIAALFSGVAVGLACLLGLLLRLPGMRQWWHSSYLWALALALLSLLTLWFGSQLGFTKEVTHLITGEEMEVLNPNLAIIAYFLLIFAIANWPIKSST